ncbi:MAG TPA: HAD family hydrolase [Ignavibacteriaceae bacterium]|nr:HAD family hydrolase [Ignavibacteriaceae bacterium]
MRKFDGIIFDVDGTLTSSNTLIFESFRHITRKHLNKIITDEEIVALFGPTEEQILRDWFKEKSDTVIKDYFEFYESNHHLADIYPGMKEILEYIKSKDVFIGIFTGKGRRATEISLKILGIFQFFDLIVSGDEVKNHKPSGEGVNLFIEHFNLDKEKVLLIGDAPVDILAAREAGIKVASVMWDCYAVDRVKQLNSDYYFNTVVELETFIKSSI